MADTHKFIGSHAEEVNGVMRAPGDTFSLSNEELERVDIKSYLEDGKLLSLKEQKKGGENE